MSDLNNITPSEIELANFEDLLTFEFDFEKDVAQQLGNATTVDAFASPVPICKSTTDH